MTRQRPTRFPVTTFFGSFCLVLATGFAQAEDLAQILDHAMANDPQIRQARASFNAQHTLVEQGRSFLLPTINMTARTSRDTQGTDGTAPGGGLGFQISEHSFANGYNSKGYGMNLRQAVLNMEAWYAYESARKGDEIAALTLAQAEQQLIIRVATAYFDVLRSQANLASFRAEEEASLQVLEQTRAQFEVSLVPITDVYDSEANADLANVNRLLEENSLEQRMEALETITGRSYDEVATLMDDFPIEPLDDGMEDWVSIALQGNMDVLSAGLDFESKKDDAQSAKAAMWPTVDLNMSYNWSQSGGVSFFGPNLPNESSAVTLNLTVPIFTGGLNRARLRQAYYTRDASEEALLSAEREATRNTRNAWRSVMTDVRSVAARAQAIVSARSALEATEVGAEAGIRNVVDVVLARRSLFQAEREYANARFNYVINTLTLKQAAGTLTPQDVAELNQWLSE